MAGACSLPMEKGDGIIMKKFLAVLTAACLVLVMAGCQQNDVSTGQINLEQTSQEQPYTAVLTNDETHFETEFEITDWSPSDFCTIKCCNADVSIPCKFSDIDEKFDKKIVKANERNVSKLDTVELYLDGEYVGVLCYPEQDYDIENDFLTYVSLEIFDINGLNEYSSKEDVQKELGAGNTMDFEYADSYFVDNMMIMFNYLNNKTSLTVVVY